MLLENAVDWKKEIVMGYKKYSDIYMAEIMIEKIKDGEITDRHTAYRELETIAGEWRGTYVGNMAEYLIEEYYSDLQYKSN